MNLSKKGLRVGRESSSFLGAELLPWIFLDVLLGRGPAYLPSLALLRLVQESSWVPHSLDLETSQYRMRVRVTSQTRVSTERPGLSAQGGEIWK